MRIGHKNCRTRHSIALPSWLRLTAKKWSTSRRSGSPSSGSHSITRQVWCTLRAHRRCRLPTSRRMKSRKNTIIRQQLRISRVRSMMLRWPLERATHSWCMRRSRTKLTVNQMWSNLSRSNCRGSVTRALRVMNTRLSSHRLRSLSAHCAIESSSLRNHKMRSLWYRQQRLGSISSNTNASRNRSTEKSTRTWRSGGKCNTSSRWTSTVNLMTTKLNKRQR